VERFLSVKGMVSRRIMRIRKSLPLVLPQRRKTQRRDLKHAIETHNIAGFEG
jgi:hypothetical protein